MTAKTCKVEGCNRRAPLWSTLCYVHRAPHADALRKIDKRARAHVGQAARDRFVVVRMWAGSWQFYAGRNEALGAMRWSDTETGGAGHCAVYFTNRADAAKVADAANAFVKKATNKGDK